jgi:hypothetical protein
MSSFKLSKLLLERASTKKPAGCGSNAAVETTQASYGTYQLKPEYETWTESDGSFTVYYYYCKKGVLKPEEKKPVVAGKCPSDEEYKNKEFQDWVWKTHLGKTDTETVTTKLCGIKADGTAKTCAYSVGVDGSCGDGTKAVWKELRDEFIKFKNGAQPIVVVDPDAKRKECAEKGLDYDDITKNCVAKPVVVDPDVEALKNEMLNYRDVLNQFTDAKSWTNIDSLSPSEYIPANLKMTMLTVITESIVSFIKRKGRSADFDFFKKMMSSLIDAYNVDKYKEFFANKIDPKSDDDVFVKIQGYIDAIDNAANESKEVYNFNPLTNPQENDVRNFLYTGQYISVYKTGSLNLMMMVYFYVKDQRVGGNDLNNLWSPKKGYWDNKPEVLEKVYNVYKNTNQGLNFDNCKKLLGVYMDTIESTVDRKNYDESSQLKERVKNEIKKCWCGGLYKDLGKLGVKNMFDIEMKKDRKKLITFLNSLGRSTWGDFGIDLTSKCGDFEEYK